MKENEKKSTTTSDLTCNQSRFKTCNITFVPNALCLERTETEIYEKLFFNVMSNTANKSVFYSTVTFQ
jgi:hypothetical protein